jgi:hypothetical protein
MTGGAPSALARGPVSDRFARVTKPRRTRILLLLAIAAALVPTAAGCGGDDDDGESGGGDEAAETQPQTTPETDTGTTPTDEGGDTGGGDAAAEETVRAYIDGVVEGDGAKVCDQFTAAEREEAETFGGEGGCAELFDELLQIVSEEQKDRIRDADPAVDVSGDRGTAAVPSLEGDGEDTIRLRKEGGEWRIADIQGPEEEGP